MIRIVCISDTHLQHDFILPEGDILIHAGDLTFQGNVPEISMAAQWLRSIYDSKRFKHIIVVPGNHDWLAEKNPGLMRMLMEDAGCIYLDHRPTEVMGLRFFGSGYTPRFFDWALNVDRGPKLAALWEQIPEDTQVLVTHGPPAGVLDTVRRPRGERDNMNFSSVSKDQLRDAHVGCDDLANRTKRLKDLKLHVFGHVHAPGVVYGEKITYVNAATCNERYKAAHAPIVIELI